MLFLDNERCPRTFDKTIHLFAFVGVPEFIHSQQVFPKRGRRGNLTIYPLMIKLISLAFLYCPIRIRDQGCENQNPVTYFKTYFIKQKNGACDIGSQEVKIQQKKLSKDLSPQFLLICPKDNMASFESS